MEIAQRRWYPLGRFRIFALPLETNEFWTTHRIYLGNKLIGRQLSVPSLSDCEWYATNMGIYADRSHTWESPKPRKHVSLRGKPGRPTREQVARREAALLAVI